MKMKLVALILLCFSNGFAQSTWDIVNVKRYETNLFSKKHNPQTSHLDRNLEVYHASIADDKNQFSKINESVWKAMTTSVENAVSYQNLINEMMKYFEVFQKIENSRNNRNYENFIPKLEKIESQVISITGDNIFYEFEYQFTNLHRYDDNIKVKHYYLGHLKTGILTKIQKPNAQQLIKIQSIIQEELKNNERKITLNNPDFFEQDETQNHRNYRQTYDTEVAEDSDDETSSISKFLELPVTRFFEKIDLKDADFLWANHGILVYFNAFTESTAYFNGQAFSFYLPFETAQKCIPHIPYLSFVSNLPPLKTSLKSTNVVAFIKKLNTSPPDILTLTEIQARDAKIKTLAVSNFQINSNQEKRKMGSNVISFNGKGQMVSKEEFDEQGKSRGITFYEYSKTGQLSKEVKKLKSEITENFTYVFDVNDNLVRRIKSSSKMAEQTYYIYNGQSVFEFSHYMFDDNLPFKSTRFAFEKDKVNIEKATYFIENGEVIGVESANAYQRAQVARNTNNRLIEAYYDYDRNRHYANYDPLNRMISYQIFNSNSMTQHIRWEYENNQTYPFKKSTKQSTDLFFEEYYEYTFF